MLFETLSLISSVILAMLGSYVLGVLKEHAERILELERIVRTLSNKPSKGI